VLVATRLPRAFSDALDAHYDVLGPFDVPLAEALDGALAGARAAHVRALVTTGTAPTTAALLERLPSLGLVACIGSGYEGVDLAAAAARGVAVTHSPGANASSVADIALGLLIASVRGFGTGRARIDRGQWHGNMAREGELSRGLTGLRVGIYGLGEIGRRIADRLVACEAQVGYHNRRPRSDAGFAWFPSLGELARWADALVIAVRAGADNRHAVDAAIIAALGPDGHVVNIARGTVIDEVALIDALANGRLAGAGLDVYEHEPQVPAALRALHNVVLTPHLGGGTLEAQAAMQAMVLRNLEAFFANAALVSPVPAPARDDRADRLLDA
jgi:lactate dehydrogenase-like 2-hydroxyacid dehydrogenase